MRKTKILRLLVHFKRHWENLPRLLRQSLWLISALFVGILGDRLSEGGGFMIFLSVAIIILLTAVLHACDRQAKKKKVRPLFWFWVAYSSIFLAVIMICKYRIFLSYRESVDRLTKQLFVNENLLLETNRFYSGITNELFHIQTQNKDMIHELRYYVAGKPTKLTYAEMMGLHDETNFVYLTNSITITNVKPNIIIANNTISYSPRLLTAEEMQSIGSKLQFETNALISLIYSDISRRDFAMQIADIFKQHNFKVQVGSVVEKHPETENQEVFVLSKRRPSASIDSAFAKLFSIIHAAHHIYINTNIADGEIIVVVNPPPIIAEHD